MASERRRKSLPEAVRRHAAKGGDDIPGLNDAKQVLAYLSWLTWHCEGFAAQPTFLAAVRADVVALLYAYVVGLERTAYLHGRSVLENLARHCCYDARPSLFVARQLQQEHAVHDGWADDLLKEMKRLPHFLPAAKDEDPNGNVLFDEIGFLYAESSRFVHGPTRRYRSLHEDIGSVALDPERSAALGSFARRLAEAGILTLALYHLGAYLLVSQPIRRYLLLAMQREARERLLFAMERVSLAWAEHQRDAALEDRRRRKRRPSASRDGLLLDRDGRVLLVSPRA